MKCMLPPYTAVYLNYTNWFIPTASSQIHTKLPWKHACKILWIWLVASEMKVLLLSTTKHCINWHLVRNEKKKKKRRRAIQNTCHHAHVTPITWPLYPLKEPIVDAERFCTLFISSNLLLYMKMLYVFSLWAHLQWLASCLWLLFSLLHLQ